MNKRSDDYIPYACEIEAAREEARERVKNIPDPRHEYTATYSINGSSITEKVFAFNIKEAEEYVRQQLSMIGMVPYDLKLTAADNTNVSVN